MVLKNSIDINYQRWLIELKEKIRSSQLKAVLKVNAEMLALYWEIGKELTERQAQSSWGDKIITQLSKDLLREFPDIKGFSRSNIFNIVKWYRFYSPNTQIVQQPVGVIKNKSKQPIDQIVQQPVGLFPAFLGQVPWGHHIQIITKVNNTTEAFFYVQQVALNNWSRAVLLHQIESGLYHRKGKAITNFDLTLPKVQSDLARETLKNPYLFGFLGLNDEMQERELEKALMQHIKKFLLELGRGFAYVGNQYNLVVEGDDYFLDLLFYNFHLHRFVVFELKVGEFKPEFAGKLNFYINTVNEQIKGTNDNPTIGVLLCKTPNKTVVEYSLKGIGTPMGVSEYELTKYLPKQLKSEMPTIKELEQELEKETIEFKENLSPVDARLLAIKEKLKRIKTDEIQTPATYEILLKLYKEGLRPLYEEIIKRLSMFEEEFYSKDFNWNAYNFNANKIEQLDELWDDEKTLRGIREVNLSFRLHGFKKAGIENFDEQQTLKFEMNEFWYGFILSNYDNQQPFLKKLYHQQLTKEDQQLIVELLMGKVMDRIEWIIEFIKSKEEKNKI